MGPPPAIPFLSLGWGCREVRGRGLWAYREVAPGWPPDPFIRIQAAEQGGEGGHGGGLSDGEGTGAGVVVGTVDRLDGLCLIAGRVAQQSGEVGGVSIAICLGRLNR